MPGAVDRLAVDREDVANSCYLFWGLGRGKGLVRTQLIPAINRTGQGGDSVPLPDKLTAPATCWALLRVEWSRCQEHLARHCNLASANKYSVPHLLPSPKCWTCKWPRKITNTANPPPAVSGSRNKWLFLHQEQRRAAPACHPWLWFPASDICYLHSWWWTPNNKGLARKVYRRPTWAMARLAGRIP